MKNSTLQVIVLLLVLLFLSLFLSFSYRSGHPTETAGTENTGKPVITATLFPQYDFAKQIVKDRAVVVMLLPPGAESHTYEPSPADILKIGKSDMFIYTGRYMEQWAEKIIDANKSENIVTVDVSEGIELIGYEKKDGKAADEDHHVLDPHIWTDPNNAIVMTDNILSALCREYPADAEFYTRNAEELKAELRALDKGFRDLVSSSERKKIVFGGRNAFHYFLRRYGLDSLAAIDHCSAEADPGVKRIAEMITEIKKENISVIYYGEMVVPKMAETISAETGTRLLQFNSCHNITEEDVAGGRTYVSIMTNNLANLKEGLE